MEIIDLMDFFWDMLSLTIGDTKTRVIAFFLFAVWILLGIHGYKVYKAVAAFEDGLIVFILLGLLDWPEFICVVIGIIAMIIVYVYFDKLLGFITFLSTAFFMLIFLAITVPDISEAAGITIIVIVSLLVAILVVKFTKPVLIIYTSLMFGMLAANAIGVVVDSSSDAFKYISIIICVAVCLVCQYKKYGFFETKFEQPFDYKSAQSFLAGASLADNGIAQPPQEFVYCTKCGKQHPVTAQFCGKCGNKLQIIRKGSN